MEKTENSDSSFSGTYDKLVCQEEFSVEENPHYGNHNQQQVSMSMVRPGSSERHYRVAAVCLGLLCALLLVVDIGLGVYYNKLRDGHLPLNGLTHISNELNKLKENERIALQTIDEAKRQLATEIRQQELAKWELEHQKRRGHDYNEQIGTILEENAALQSRVALIKEGCIHCLPGWTFLNSVCYYFPFSDTITRRSWQAARDTCKRNGADLAVIDSRTKQLSISKLINDDQDPSRPMHISGFWIGLRDVQEEGTWRWLDGTTLVEGYWNDGEPNNANNEDCAAVYPRSNPFKAWNDALCGKQYKWICEMAPMSRS
ncbi:uncharacterized protein ACJ7VT_003780 isoform 2-T2 [Polymixia lowei]